MIDDLLDQAMAAINRGDRVTATALADRVLAVDRGNADAEDLLTAPSEGGEIRRMTILYVTLVDSAELSARAGIDTYGVMVGGYRDLVLDVVKRFDGHIGSPGGEGLLALFGHPTVHEDDLRRAVMAGLDIMRGVTHLSQQFRSRFGIGIAARAGVHRGFVYLDPAQDDVFGLGANFAARVAGLAKPGTLVVSDAVAPLIRSAFDLDPCTPAPVKGVAGSIAHHRVLSERSEPTAVKPAPLVGRDAELGCLQDSWARAQSGTPTTQGVVIRGEPGMGKSRLAAAVAELAEKSGAAVLTLTGAVMHTKAGLYPVRSLLEQRCGITRHTTAGDQLRLLRAEVTAGQCDPTSMVPLLAPVLNIGPEHGYQPVAAEGRRLYQLIAQAIQDYLVACVGERPGLVVAEDIHWFDPSTLEILRALLLSDLDGLLVVATGRPGEWLPADWPVTVLDLGPLPQREADKLIGLLDPDLSAEARAAIAARCDGVPFYIEQVVCGLAQPGVPEGLYEPLLARLRASANVVPIAEAAALIGRELDRGLLGSVIGLDEDVVDAALAELKDAGVLEPWGSTGWRFRHELLREVAAELAPPSVCRGLHAKVADALVRGARGAPDWQLVATHYEQAARPGDAVSAYRQASTDARRRGALVEATGYLARALTQVDELAQGRARDLQEMEVRLERGFLASATSGPLNHTTAVDFEECLRLSAADLRDDIVVGTLLALAGYYFAVGNLPRSTQLIATLRAGMTGEREYFRPIADASLGIAGWLNGEFSSARAQMEAATERYSRTGRHTLEALWFNPTDPLTMAHGVHGLDRIAHGDLSGAEAQVRLAARRGDELSFPQGPFSLAFARFFEFWIRMEASQFDRAAMLAAEQVEQAEQHSFEVWALWGAAQQAIVDAMASTRGDPADPDMQAIHVARATELVKTVRGAGLTIFVTLFDGALARLLIAVDRVEEAGAQLDAAIALGREADMRFYEAELLRLRAHTRTDPEVRNADLAAAVDVARRQGADLYELRAALDAFHLNGETARTALVDVVGRFDDDTPLKEVLVARSALN
ncbi:ATP-binding protein [Mycolicibacterium xanthum]|uniref:ATP-binding protein n=1 Tax=Mycolicibacterium xanthum TaxID=2796469 RepID=UPI002102D34D|nr:adenylate/guanylate cyclase domain-containing protein [Mycolicibacterium xanthum]